MKYKLPVIVLLLSFIFSSCDDEYKSPGEIAAGQFSKMVNEEYVDKVNVQLWGTNGYYVVQSEAEFTVEGAFLVVRNDYYYNFEQLDFFTYDGGKRGSVYFK